MMKKERNVANNGTTMMYFKCDTINKSYTNNNKINKQLNILTHICI